MSEASRKAAQALTLLQSIHPGNMTPMAEDAWRAAIDLLRGATATPPAYPVRWPQMIGFGKCGTCMHWEAGGCDEMGSWRDTMTKPEDLPTLLRQMADEFEVKQNVLAVEVRTVLGEPISMGLDGKSEWSQYLRLQIEFRPTSLPSHPGPR
jgi:hypothetical protein